jgi:hypothetical protein
MFVALPAIQSCRIDRSSWQEAERSAVRGSPSFRLFSMWVGGSRGGPGRRAWLLQRSRPGPDMLLQIGVQSVSSSEVVLKELDGSTVTVARNGDTSVVVDGKPASISDVEDGYVGIAIRDGDGAARFSASATRLGGPERASVVAGR